MAFSFGSTPKTAATGFTLPTNPTTTTAATGFQFSTGSGDSKTQNKPSTGLFGTAASSTASFTFGPSQPKTSAPTLTFGAPATSPPTLNFGAPITSAPALSFGAPTTSAPTLSFGAPTTSATTLTFGAPSSSAAPSLVLGSTATTSTTTTTTPQMSFGSSTSASTVSFTPILGSATPTPTTGIALGITSSASSAPPPAKLSFGLGTTASNATTTTTTTLGTTSTSLAPTNVTSTTSTIPATGSLTFAQLEDSINKWTIDLEEQGKFFINQAKQLNAWDTLLISNGEKILNLNCSIERVKQQQQQLDQELDFVLAQQKELEELIVPLEKELIEVPVTDIDRNQMYQFSEIIDSQLKQMSDDLKEIIEHINESNKDEEISNPITQISRILNAHMNSLQWIDRNTAQISTQLEQITKMQDSNRRNFSLNHSINM